MNAYLHASENRGHVQMGWLNTYHSFSFGSWYNPKYMGVSALRVINDDTIDAHNGFGTHPHDNMEILTCVLSGTISHRDSMGNSGDIKAGEWQLMSAGTGVTHSEFNHGDEPVHLLQIWIRPNVQNVAPNYQQIALDVTQQPNQWHVIVGADDAAPMQICQDAEVKSALISTNSTLNIKAKYKHNYVHVISGRVQIGEHFVQAGDALLFDDAAEVLALQDSQLIWFDLPAM